MQKKLIINILFFASLFTLSLIYNTSLNAKKCDYVDEEGFCTVIVDNKEDDVIFDEESSGDLDVNIDTDENINSDPIDNDKNGIGDIVGNEKDQLAIFEKEFWQIQKDSAWVIGDEVCYVNARKNGLSYIESYNKCFSPDYVAGAGEVADLITENKNWITSFFQQANAESIKETLKKLFDTVSSWFS